MRAVIVLTAALSAAPLGASAAAAQSGPLEPILTCRTITEDAERLACFDDAARALSGDQTDGEIVVVRREQIEQAERESFGFSIPGVSGLASSIGALFASDDAAGEPEPHHVAEAPVRTAAASEAEAVNEREPEAQAEPTGDPAADAQPAPQARSAERAQVAAQADPGAEPAPDPVAQATGVEVVERNNDGEAIVVAMTIDRAHEFDYQRHRFYMTNGQVWEQLETVRLRLPRNGEARAYIRRLPMGGYVLRINDRGRAADVRRIR